VFCVGVRYVWLSVCLESLCLSHLDLSYEFETSVTCFALAFECIVFSCFLCRDVILVLFCGLSFSNSDACLTFWGLFLMYD